MTVLEIVGEPLKINRLARGSELEDRVAALLRQRRAAARIPAPLSARLFRRRSASASASPARSRSTRASSSPTRRSRPSMSRCRRRCSTCCRTCRTSSASPISSSRTTSAVVEHISRPRRGDVCRPHRRASADRRRSSPTRSTPTPRRCSPPCRCPIPRLRRPARASALRARSPIRRGRRRAAPSTRAAATRRIFAGAQPPPLRDIAAGHRAACHFADTLSLKGVVAKAA